jgi:hypothetical protein
VPIQTQKGMEQSGASILRGSDVSGSSSYLTGMHGRENPNGGWRCWGWPGTHLGGVTGGGDGRRGSAGSAARLQGVGAAPGGVSSVGASVPTSSPGSFSDGGAPWNSSTAAPPANSAQEKDSQELGEARGRVFER